MIEIIQGQSKHPPKWLNHAWDKHLESYLNHQEDILFLRYEDLLENPFKEGQKIANFMRYDILDKRLIKTISEQSFETKKKKYSDENDFFNKTHLRKGETQEWKTELTNQQVERINDSFEKLMHRYNYL